SPANTKETASPVKAGGVPWPVPVAGGAGSVGLLAWLRKLVTK
ncbi:mannosyl-glycoprotein endo-beta-N-acetylglucosamidase, partial [Limosilactobacillus fermentum]|nr:mannosyl-glycoprotein endo-beta-N-acetylglucosamidase [Limosilactobacillus fermentum]